MNNEADKSVIYFEFTCKKEKQKLLLDVLLTYSQLDLIALSTLLEVQTKLLADVCKGTDYLNENAQRELAQMFLLLFSE